LNENTVTGDDDTDSLAGGADLDWFWAEFADELVDFDQTLEILR
jgi:hypothetical protein